MGRAIYYCVQCSQRVSDTDIDAGKAFRIGEMIVCATCAPPGTKPSTSKKIPAVAPRKSAGTSVAMRSVTASLVTAGRGRKRLLILTGGLAAVIVVAIATLVLRRDAGPPPAPPNPVPTVKVPEPPPVQPVEQPPVKPAEAKEAGARADLEKARAFAKTRPEDLSGQLRELTDIVWKWEGTEAAGEAAREAAAVKTSIMEKVASWMADLELQIKGLLEAKQFAAAERKIEELKKAHDLPEWRLAVEKRAAEIFAMGKRAGESEGGKKPDGKSPTEEGKVYLAKWESAAAKATARDFGGAVAELEQSAAAFKEADVKQDLESDLALFRKIGAVHKGAMDYLVQRRRGAGITVGVRDGKGEVMRISGQILQIDGERVEVRSGKISEFVDWADVTAATFGEVAQQGNFEPAVLSALCLLEGEREAAKAFGAELPQRWGTYADAARAKIPKPDPVEKNARDLYVAAEKGYRSMDTFGDAVEKYKTLRTDFAATALVKKYSERIFRRSDAGRDYYYSPSDFRMQGTIQPAKSGKLESTSDSDDRDTLQNSAEIEFAVLPGLAYRCWLQVGACCEETFHFYYQGTEVTETDAKTKKKIACEPGSTFAAPVKHTIRNLKKTHDEHKAKGAKVHPKTAARWEWIEIVLPKYAGPGGKKLRFMTSNAGFSIGGACVSSTRKAPPLDPEIKELEKLRSFDEPPPIPIDPAMVAWWTFEEGSGEKVSDVSGKNHDGKLVGTTQWTEGKIGGGLQVGGGISGVQVADAEDLRLSGDLTMALWLKRSADSADWVCILGRGNGGERNYGLWLEPGSKRWMFQQYGGQNIDVLGTKLIEERQWLHLAVVIQGSAVRLFYNGQLDAEKTRPGAPVAGSAPVGIGYAISHSGFNGVVDDVRLYRRALSADELRSVYLGGR